MVLAVMTPVYLQEVHGQDGNADDHRLPDLQPVDAGQDVDRVGAKDDDNRKVELVEDANVNNCTGTVIVIMIETIHHQGAMGNSIVGDARLLACKSKVMR